jgi:uncharacterized protein DUF7010
MKRRLTQALGGAFVFAVFGSLWGVYGAYWFRISWWLPAIPLLIGGLMILASTKLETRVNALADEPATRDIDRREARAGRTFVIVNIAQGIAIFIAVQVWYNLHKPEYLAPTIALIVGLHFFALARPMKLPSHWVVGGLICLVAVGTVLAVPTGYWGPVVGLGNAAILWVASAHRLHEVQSAL